MPVIAHSLEVRTKAIAMLRNGIGNAEVARALHVPVGTIGAWKHKDRRRSGTLPGRRVSICPRCDPGGRLLNRRSYAYLLGLYLGDGYIGSGKQMREKGVTFLSISCADAWPGLMDECEASIRDVMPGNSVHRVQRPGMHEVKAYSKHWTCLFPQHGPGRKHERPIVLEDWQREIVAQFPERFIGGLIHSDGCRVYNMAVRTRGGKTTRYYYSRYHFTNESPHIRDLFTEALDRLGVRWRYNNRNCVSIARRESVRRLDSFVGPKY
ncbi:hypothetical protein KDL01_34310 [Actinospica durhamensis]|uniref:Helix-turn-helix domain-containing protein n=1 Tax=Actinospica durhamensis TaxID=1508375 RepID=A0A941ISE0_9ACTN|nr:hypothetical protein [Actinospica durhamensis]MBR7838394.1 hypothetical protein [Actinospica durhamensis]